MRYAKCEMGTRKKKVITRKPHRCYICGKWFPKKTTMFVQIDDFDNFASIYTCEECENKVTDLVGDNILI